MNRERLKLLTSLTVIGMILGGAACADEPTPGKPAAQQKGPERPRVIPPEKRWKGQVDITNDTDVKRRARESLDAMMEMQFPNTTRREICRYLQQIHNVPFRLDEGPLNATDCPLDKEILVIGTFTSMRSALPEIFSKRVDWMAVDDGLFISTREKIRDTLEIRYYDLSTLTAAGLKPEDILFQAADAVKATRVDAGKFSIEGQLLVVEQNQKTQAGVLSFLYGKLKPILMQPGKQ